MSAEYLLKMEVLRRNREEMTARRQEIERRIALREATAAEYSVIALQSCKQKWKSLRASAIAAKKRNDEFIREIHETQRKVDEVYVRTTQKLWPSDNQLELEKARYLRKVEELYPAWQEKMQVVRIQTLRELEEKKRAVQKRRYLAKKARAFETEQTLDDLIQQTSHEIGLAENLEKNEVFEREVLRSQSAIQATRLDESIRDHAAGARMFMKQQALEELTAAQRVQVDVEEQIFETFSPRGAIKAMREANNSIAIVGPADNNAEDSHERPPRSMNIAIPKQQYRVQAVENPLPDPYANTQLPPSEPTASARVWARSGLGAGSEKLSAGSVDAAAPYVAHNSRNLTTAPDRSPQPVQTSAPESRSVAYEAKQIHAESTNQSERTSSAASSARDHLPDLAVAFNKLSAESITYPVPRIPIENDQAFAHETIAPCPSTYDDRREVSALKSAFMALATATETRAESFPRGTQPLSTKGVESKCSPFESNSSDHERPSTEKVHDSQQDRILTPDITVTTTTTENISIPIAQTPQPLSMTHPVETYKFVELKRQDSSPKMIEEEEKSFNSTDQECKQASSPRSMALSDDAPRPADLSLSLINSFDSNQSSLMDFSVGKLLQTPATKPAELKGPEVDLQPSPPSNRSGKPPSPSAGIAVSPTPSTADSTKQEKVSCLSSSRTTSFEKKTTADPEAVSTDQPDTRAGSFGAPQYTTHTTTALATDVESSLVFSSLELTSEIDSPAPKLADDTMIESVSDFGSPVPIKEVAGSPKDSSTARNSPLQLPTDQQEPATPPSLFATMSMPERLKALTALITRVEEGVNDGEQLSGCFDSESPRDTKRELLRMAASGRKAQINFFGSDVCFELVVDLARELGPVLFPAKAFDGILSDQKMKKVHQNGKEKESDMWKAFSTHIKQLYTAKSMPVSSLIDLFSSAFLSHDATNLRSQRKLRELLLSVCGASENASKKETASASPRHDQHVNESVPTRGSMSIQRETPSSPHVPSLLQTAFLQTASPPKAKTYGIASSGFKKKSSTEDVLKSMASSPTKLSQKLMRGGKMGDYSEFEEEDEVDLENLIGSKPSIANSNTTARPGASKRGGGGHSGARLGGVREDKDDFDVDF